MCKKNKNKRTPKTSVSSLLLFDIQVLTLYLFLVSVFGISHDILFADRLTCPSDFAC